MNQLISNNAHMLQNGCCFPSVSQISQESPCSLWETYKKGKPGMCPSALPSCIRKPSRVLILWFWIWEAHGRCEAILRFQQDGSGRGSQWAGGRGQGRGTFQQFREGLMRSWTNIVVVETEQSKNRECTELGVWLMWKGGREEVPLLGGGTEGRTGVGRTAWCHS